MTKKEFDNILFNSEMDNTDLDGFKNNYLKLGIDNFKSLLQSFGYPNNTINAFIAYYEEELNE